jgi:hypothetical protein
MTTSHPSWRSKVTTIAWYAACSEAIGLVALFVTIAACASAIHNTYFVTKLGRFLLAMIALICLASFFTFQLALFAYGKRRVGAVLFSLATLLISLGMLGVAE